VPALLDACRRLDEHPQFIDIYPEYLFLLHSMTRAAVPLMEDAVRQLNVRTDTQARSLVEYFESHTLEEEGHDRWILEDLEKLGVRRQDVLRRMPSPTIAGLVGAQYYWIHHHDPVALLGYIAVLEGYPAAISAVEELMRRITLPRAAFRTLREHAAVDGDHSFELDRLIDRLPLTDEQFSLICVNGLMTVVGLIRCVDEILDAYETRPDYQSLGAGGCRN